MKPTHVAVDARIVPGSSGGIETVVEGLALGLSQLNQNDIRVTFVTYKGVDEWIQPYLREGITVYQVDTPGRSHSLRRKTRFWAVRPSAGSYGVLPPADATFDRIDPDVIHFPFQTGYRVRKPFIYHPHDLQHRHLPEHFSKRQRAGRNVVYGDLCRRASAIAVGTSWVKKDLVDYFDLDPNRIFVVPLAPGSPTRTAPGQGQLPSGIPKDYAFYPAVSWPHKNHKNLFLAIKELRALGTPVPLVLTGSRHGLVDLRALASSIGVQDLVHDLGYVGADELECLAKNSRLTVIPTLFEAASFPIWEAFLAGSPVVSSNVTSLPRQVGDAGLIFDPNSPKEIARAISDVWHNPDLARRLSDLGKLRVSSFTWKSSAIHFSALYRLLAGSSTPTDADLLSSTPPL
jgi:glycosyltransferase involved in cell wall biosynthesis